MHNRYWAVIWLLLLPWLRGNATTVVVVVTPSGIVVGADSKGTPTGTLLKVVPLKGKFIVASLYAEQAKGPDGITVIYDFPSWIKEIDKYTDTNVSVSSLTNFIGKKMPETFSFASALIKSGQLTREQATAEGIDSYLVQYVIAGYENSLPLVYSLVLMPDWDAKAVKGPFKVQLREEQGQRADLFINYRGQGVSLSKIGIANSDEQKEFSLRVPTEFSAMRDGKDLTIDQASNIVRAMLGMESKANPRFVGFPITIVTLLKDGGTRSMTYRVDCPTFPCLPEKTEK